MTERKTGDIDGQKRVASLGSDGFTPTEAVVAMLGGGAGLWCSYSPCEIHEMGIVISSSSQQVRQALEMSGISIAMVDIGFTKYQAGNPQGSWFSVKAPQSPPSPLAGGRYSYRLCLNPSGRTTWFELLDFDEDGVLKVTMSDNDRDYEEFRLVDSFLVYVKNICADEVCSPEDVQLVD